MCEGQIIINVSTDLEIHSMRCPTKWQESSLSHTLQMHVTCDTQKILIGPNDAVRNGETQIPMFLLGIRRHFMWSVNTFVVKLCGK